MKKPRFLMDVDGIVADFVGTAIKIMRDMSGQDIQEHHILDWEVTEVLEDLTLREKAKARFKQKGFCESFELYDGAQEAVKRLDEMCDFHFVTAPMTNNYDWMPERLGWLVKHFNIPANRIHFITEKYITTADFFLDDAEKNVEKWSAHNPHATTLLWNRHWNKKEVDPRIIRVNSWDEVIRIVENSLP